MQWNEAVCEGNWINRGMAGSSVGCVLNFLLIFYLCFPFKVLAIYFRRHVWTIWMRKVIIYLYFKSSISSDSSSLNSMECIFFFIYKESCLYMYTTGSPSLSQGLGRDPVTLAMEEVLISEGLTFTRIYQRKSLEYKLSWLEWGGCRQGEVDREVCHRSSSPPWLFRGQWFSRTSQ